ncbi:hypothetical protein [Streptomyces daliensis]|uniref:Transcriptional regulator n=1 Tax=Streptomyces daliensis TaxID=299421 RepID=A0A8T4IVZ4_9ACTN|nr:hypothetical protein [Streptomyces daliensis]
MSKVPNRALRQLVDEAGWGAAQVSRAVRRVAAEHDKHSGEFTCDPSTVSRWFGGTQPHPQAATYLLEALSRRLRRPVTAREAGLTRAPAPVLDLSWGSDPLRKLSWLTSAELDAEQRRLLSSGTFSYAALDPSTACAPRLAHRGARETRGDRTAGERERRGAGQAAVEQLDAMTRMYAAAVAQHGGPPVRSSLAAYLAHTATPLLRTWSATEAHPRLMAATAQLVLLLGNTCVDGGDDASAQHYHHTAARLADDADDETTLAIALRTMASHAHDLGHHTPEVLHLAEHATRMARHAPPPARAYTLTQLAVMQAHHDRRSALATFTRAERLYTSTAPSGPFTSYPIGGLHYQRAEMLATIGDSRGATRALLASLGNRASEERLASALTRARLGETLFRLGQLDRALTHWQAFCDLSPALYSARVVHRLHLMRRLLAPHRNHPTAVELLTRAPAFPPSSLVATLPDS